MSVSSIRTPPIASSRHCRISRFASSTLPRLELLDAELRRHAREEAVQRCVRHRAALHRVRLRVDRPRGEEPLEEPGGGAVGEALELGHRERGARGELLEHERVREPCRPVEGAQCALEPPRPAVRARESLRCLRVVSCELGERPQPLTLGRRVLERPGQGRERPPPRPAPHVVGVEERLDVVPERARLARAAVVVRGLAHEIEPLRGARARRVEEVAVVLDGIRPHEPRAALVERTPCVVVEERRAAAATRQAPLLQPEDEDGVEAARAGAEEIDHRDAARVVARPAGQRGPFDRGRDVLAAQLPAELLPALELSEKPPQCLVGPEIEPARGVRRRSLEAVRVPEHSFRELPHRLDRIGGVAQLRERGQRPLAQPLGLLDDALRSLDRASTEAPLDEVDRPPLEPRERRAEEAEEIAARPSSPTRSAAAPRARVRAASA